MLERRSHGSEKYIRGMLVITSLGGLAIASGGRIVPENFAWSRIVNGASGLRLIPPMSPPSLQMAGQDEVPDPLGVREEMQHANFGHAAEAAPSNKLEMDSKRIADRGGAPTDSWKVGHRSAPAMVKEISIRNEEDFFAAQNELEAIRKMLGRGIFLKAYDMWYRSEGDILMKIVTVTEDYTCTLKDLLDQRELDTLFALDLFVDIADDLGELRLSRIAHDPPTANEIFIVGDTQHLSSCRAMLCSSLTNTDRRIRSSRASVGRFLAGRDLPPTATVLSKAQAKKADMDGLAQLFNALAAGLVEEEHKKLVELVNHLQYHKSSSDIVKLVKDLRKKWLVRYPQDAAKQMAKRQMRIKDGTRGSTAAILDDEAHVARVIKSNMKEASRLMRTASNGGPQFHDDEQFYDSRYPQVDYSVSDSEAPLHMTSEAYEGDSRAFDELAQEYLFTNYNGAFPIDGV